MPWYAVCMFRLLYGSGAVPFVPNSNHGGWYSLVHVIIKGVAMWVNLCWCQRYCGNMCSGYTVTVCVSHKARWMEGQEQREGERIDECRHSGRAGERWRALFFSLSLFPQCREVTSSSAIWRECHATLPLPSPQTQMKFYFLCHAVERKQFFSSLINVWYVGRQYTRRQ